MHRLEQRPIDQKTYVVIGRGSRPITPPSLCIKISSGGWIAIPRPTFGTQWIMPPLMRWRMLRSTKSKPSISTSRSNSATKDRHTKVDLLGRTALAPHLGSSPHANLSLGFRFSLWFQLSANHPTVENDAECRNDSVESPWIWEQCVQQERVCGQCLPHPIAVAR